MEPPSDTSAFFLGPLTWTNENIPPVACTVARAKQKNCEQKTTTITTIITAEQLWLVCAPTLDLRLKNNILKKYNINFLDQFLTASK